MEVARLVGLVRSYRAEADGICCLLTAHPGSYTDQKPTPRS